MSFKIYFVFLQNYIYQRKATYIICPSKQTKFFMDNLCMFFGRFYKIFTSFFFTFPYNNFLIINSMSIFVWMEPMIILDLTYSYEETLIYSFFYSFACR